MESTSSITDKPIHKKNESLLNIDNYAEALTKFITTSATPLTIGFQGEWGTGKTSLMYIVKEDLEKGNIATSWVNTWEYALFKEPFEITPGVLTGLLDNLVNECKKKGYWSNLQKIDDLYRSAIEGLSSLSNILLRAGSAKLLGVQIGKETKEQKPKEIAKLKSEIQEIINKIINEPSNPLKKIVFFIDDLDRIDPSIAVEVLEALKNLFDIDNCVFVVAIDYEVVVKGLEKKFGPKTENNEREFRSFFDKIIQVPFTMPINVYDIENLLKTKLNDLSFNISEDALKDYIEIVKLTVGYIPRSIKRYVNSFSLLRNIRHIKRSLINDDLSNSDADEELIDFALFALIGIQISYPKIFRIISKSHEYIKWDKKFAFQIGLDNITIPEYLENYVYTDDEWEQVVWSYCQKDSYLKPRAINVLQAMNVLKDKVEEDFTYIAKAMEFASMTSVDDDIESKDNSGRYQRTVLNTIDEYIDLPKNNGADEDSIELLRLIDRDLQHKFIDKDVKFLYTPTGGASLYLKRKTRGGKFTGIELSTSGSSHIEIILLRDHRLDYQKPSLEGIEVSDMRSYSLSKKCKNFTHIEYYRILIRKKEDYNDKVRELILESFEIRDKEMPILTKKMKKQIKNLLTPISEELNERQNIAS